MSEVVASLSGTQDLMLLMRQTLIEGLGRFAADSLRMEEMFTRSDDLTLGSQEAVLDQARALVRAWVREPRTRPRVTIGYPMAEARLPCLALVEASDTQDSSSLTHADRQKTIETVDADGWGVRQSVLGHQRLAQVQVSAWSVAPELSHFLSAVALNILTVDVHRLQAGGVQSVTTAKSGTQLDAPQFPHVRYLPMVTASVSYRYRTSTRQDRLPSSMGVTFTFTSE